MQMIGVMAQPRPVNTGLSGQLLDGQDQTVASPTVAAPAAAAAMPVGTLARGVPQGFAGLVQQGPPPAIPLPTNPLTAKKGGFSKGNILTALLGSNFGM
jgi:hypothetical protein